MPRDVNLRLINGDDGAGGDVDDTVTGSWVAITGGMDLDVQVVVPQAAGTNPTMDIALQLSTDESNNDRGSLDIEQITAAGVYKRPFKVQTQDVTHVRAVLTVGGTSENFGAVTVDLGKFDERSD